MRLKIDWTGFACTEHWLRGVALFAYEMYRAHEEFWRMDLGVRDRL